MVREKDVCWEYCEKLDGNKVRCKFCLRVLNGGISRLKFHLSRLPSKGVHPCSKVRDDVTDRVKAIIDLKDQGKEVSTSQNQRSSEAKPLGIISHVRDPTPLEVVAPTPVKLLPSNSIVKPHAPLDADRCVAEFFFENGLDFSVARSSSYQFMIDAIGGSGNRGPTPEALKTTWLPKFKSEICLQAKEMEKDWATVGCTIMAETWTDSKLRALINFFVSCPTGTFFLRSVDASSYFKDTKCLYDLFDSVIQEVGPDNVVQVVVDNALNYVSVGSAIVQNYGSIFWSPCAAHCLNLILEDFSKIDWVNRCILQAQSVTKFVYNHACVLELMKSFTGGQELFRAGITKSVSNFLSLQSMLKLKQRIKHLFGSPEFSSSPYANRPHGISCMDIVDDNEFWREVEEVAAISEPVLRVLREVSCGKPAVGSIYESMSKAKESIRTYYIMDEGKCKTFLDIMHRRWLNQLHSPLHAAAAYLNPGIHYNSEVKFLHLIKEDFFVVLEKLLPTPESRHNITSQVYTFDKAQGMFGSNLAKEACSTTPPGMWWDQYGDSSPVLQRIAIRLLSQACSAPALGRNWAAIQQLHLDRRNRLERESLHDLLYVRYNLKLTKRGSEQQLLDADPLVCEDAETCSDWAEEAENAAPTLWLDRLGAALDSGDLNVRQFNGSIFSSNDPIFGL